MTVSCCFPQLISLFLSFRRCFKKPIEGERDLFIFDLKFAVCSLHVRERCSRFGVVIFYHLKDISPFTTQTEKVHVKDTEGVVRRFLEHKLVDNSNDGYVLKALKSDWSFS